MIHFCTQCGNALSDGDKFCSRCGKAISEQLVQETSISTPPPVITDTHAPSSTKVSPDSANGANVDPLKALEPEQFPYDPVADQSTGDPKFLKSFANSLAISIWWKISLALLILSLLVGFLSAIDTSATSNPSLVLSLLIILYLLIIAYVPFHTLRSLIGKSITLVDQGAGFAVTVGSIEIYPPPVSDNNNIALTWGYVWRLAVVSTSLAAPFRLTGYSPDDLEQFLVSTILLLLACWLAALWLVFVPYGKLRFRSVLNKTGQG